MLVAAVDALEADPALAARLARVLGIVAPVDVRVPLAEVPARYRVSGRWCASRGVVLGPRGARYVLASSLEAELSKSTTARRKPAAPVTSTNLEDDARAAVVDLAARRRRTA